MKLRRYTIAMIVMAILLFITGSAGAGVVSVVKLSASKHVAVVNPLAKVTRVPDHAVTLTRAQQVPVLLYHEMDNDCSPSAPTCVKSHDYESVSLTQFRNEMQWMYNQGYHTVTLSQYLQWLSNPETLLPPHPFLITVDNGIGDFLTGAQPVLYHYRYTATAFLVTGFINGASGHCSPYLNGILVQPDCPQANKYWDLTWGQLNALSPQVYSFGIEAGTDGHYEETYTKNCFSFVACKMPGESNTAYEHRILNEYDNGISELAAQFGTRFNSLAWVVPYSDLGYACSRLMGCAYEHYTGPAGWLAAFAAANFQAVFVQDAYRNGIDHERFRYEIHADMTLKQFTGHMHSYLAAGSWKR